MHTLDLRARIDEEQRGQMIAWLESLGVTLFSVVTAAILPQLIVQYLLRDGEFPTAQPLFLTYMPHVAYGLAALVFLWTIITNMSRRRRIMQLREEIAVLEVSGHDCCGCGQSDEEEMSLDAEALETMTTASVAAPVPKAKKRGAKKKTRAAKKE